MPSAADHVKPTTIPRDDAVALTAYRGADLTQREAIEESLEIVESVLEVMEDVEQAEALVQMLSKLLRPRIEPSSDPGSPANGPKGAVADSPGSEDGPHQHHQACVWQFPDPAEAEESENLLAAGGDLEVATLLHAYERGLYPMPLQPGGLIGWWSPNPRAILEVGSVVMHRSLRKSMRRHEIRVDTCFDAVMEACADPARPHGWIDIPMREAYSELHQAGHAHSVEAWRHGELQGGLYGVCMGGLFAGESMFHRGRDASKVALAALAEGLNDGHPRLIDAQQQSDHLRSMGVTTIARGDYLQRLRQVLHSPKPEFLTTRR